MTKRLDPGNSMFSFGFKGGGGGGEPPLYSPPPHFFESKVATEKAYFNVTKRLGDI